MNNNAPHKINVEWDLEVYEESMAAILAWAPEEVEIEVKGSELLVKDDTVHTFKESGTISCDYIESFGLSFYFNKSLLFQLIKGSEQVIEAIPKIVLGALSQEQFTTLMKEVEVHTIEVVIIEAMTLWT